MYEVTVGSALFLSAMKSHYWEETKAIYPEGEPVFSEVSSWHD